MYSEELKFGSNLPSAKLYVGENNFHITWLFPSSKRGRYDAFTLFGDGYAYGHKIDEYIKAWRNNYKRYLELKCKKTSLDGNIEIFGECNMMIRVGGMFDGVCVEYMNMPINTEEKLNSLINRLENIDQRVAVVRKELFNTPIKEEAWKKKRIADIKRQIAELQNELEDLER